MTINNYTRIDLVSGQKVFHFKHGVCEVMSPAVGDISGTHRLKHQPSATTIIVAENKLPQLIRGLVEQKIINTVFAELKKEQKKLDCRSSGIKEINKKLYSGNPIKIAAVLRDSYNETEPSGARLRCTNIAMGLLVPEIALVQTSTEKIVTAQIIDTLHAVKYSHLENIT